MAEAVERGRDPREARRSLERRCSIASGASTSACCPGSIRCARTRCSAGGSLMKRKTTSAAAILSLGLAIGSCAAAFRLIDALLWRPLPVARCGPAVPGRPLGRRSRRQPAARREQRVSVVRAACATAVEGRGRPDRDLVRRSSGPHLRLRRGDGEGAAPVRFRIDVRCLSACGRPRAGCSLENDDRMPGAHPGTR